jgi:membrane dipeptidase
MGAISRHIDVNTRVASLFDTSLVWDNHACMPLRSDVENFMPQLQRYRESGVDLVSLNVGYDGVPWDTPFEMLAHYRRWIRRNPDNYLLVEKLEDIAAAKRSGKLGVVFDIEGGCALNGRLNLVEGYYELGVRWMLIAYNRNNLLGGGCKDEDSGLTAFGRQVVAEMERVGMVVCCTHTGFRTTMDVMECASKPVIFSHSNPASVWPHRRNIRDEAIKACAATDGVVGITGIGIFLGKNDNRAETFARHVDYVVNLVGPQHVALGLDYVFDEEEMRRALAANPEMFPPEEYGGEIALVRPEQIPAIAAQLISLGYDDETLRGILGDNLLRVARKVWRE